MKSTAKERSDNVERAAAEWLMRRNGGLSPEQQAQLEGWLAADPANRAAFGELDSAWHVLSFPLAAGRAAEAKCQLRAWSRARQRTRRRITALASGVALVVVVALGSLRAPSGGVSAEASVNSMVRARPNVQTLPDGSTVELNANAQIVVEFTEKLRVVTLQRGEAHFVVAKNPSRPFVVSAGGVTVRAVGTAFVVRHADAEVDVLVTEGQVAVARVDPEGYAGLSEQSILLATGECVQMPVDPTRAPVVAPKPLSAEEIALALAWRGQRVEFTRTPLADAVALFNRQNRLRIELADAGTAQIEISGIFWADDPESFTRLIEAGFNVNARRSGDVITIGSR